MRDGFTAKEIAAILNLRHASSATDAVNPQLRKMCRLFVTDPLKFLEMATPVLREVLDEMEQERFEAELPRREERLEGLHRENGRPSSAPTERA